MQCVNRARTCAFIGNRCRFLKLSLADYYVVTNAKVEMKTPGILDSSFKMSVGETVVAGTSKISDEALVVLLTALPATALRH